MCVFVFDVPAMLMRRSTGSHSGATLGLLSWSKPPPPPTTTTTTTPPPPFPVPFAISSHFGCWSCWIIEGLHLCLVIHDWGSHSGAAIADVSSASLRHTRHSQKPPFSLLFSWYFLLSRLIRDGGLNPVIRPGSLWCLDGADPWQNGPQMLPCLNL